MAGRYGNSAKTSIAQNASQQRKKEKGIKKKVKRPTNCRVQTGMKMSASDAILISHWGGLITATRQRDGPKHPANKNGQVHKMPGDNKQTHIKGYFAGRALKVQ